jgi:CBS domain-containing protein/mannitol/fructose-specific phosphotransferase system IIA component (Ntr-type)
MQLTELLAPDLVVAPLQATGLGAALDELIDCLDRTGELGDRPALERALTGGRRFEVVGAAPDVVLPHFRTTAVERLLVALGTSPGGLDASEYGLEARPRVVVLVIAPPHAATLYLQAVSAIARWLREPGVIDQLAMAASHADVHRLAAGAGLRLQQGLTVRDIMVHGVRSVSPATPVRDAVDIMVRYRLRALPVVGEKQEVLGVISEWDLMRGLLPQIPRAGRAAEVAIPETLRVRDVMTRSVLCITEELGIDEAANMMINKDVEQFPVTREGKLTGLVTRGDIIRKLFGR